MSTLAADLWLDGQVVVRFAAVLAVYKPLGMTPYGRGKQGEKLSEFAPTTFPMATAAGAATATDWPNRMYLPGGVILIGFLLVFLISGPGP